MPQKDPRKTEKATPRRREKAREEGNVPRSEEISKVVVLVAGVISLRFFCGYIARNFFDIYRFILGNFQMELTRNTTYYLLLYCMKKILLLLLPIVSIIAVMSFIAIRLQIGHIFTFKVFKVKWEMFNPIQNLKNRLFSLRTFIEISKSSFQVLLVGIVAYFAIKNQMKYLPSLFYQNIYGITTNMLFIIHKVTWILFIPLIIIAILHLFYTRWDYEENLKMTKQEVKDEHKQLYGSPEVKSEQRKRMQKVMMSRMMEEVPKADVVITNPTHLAVALKYDAKETPAPIVVAKGAGLIAQRIKKIALEHNIPIKEDKPLAQALYKSVEVGEVIPEEFYQAVASVLASLEKFRKKYAR
jgi:flagellar biosynthetic protein FlhB